MAAPTAADVRVGTPLVTGGVWSAVKGTALPATANVALNAAFAGLGYIDESGVVQSISADTKDIVAWGGDTVRVIQTSHGVTFKLTMIETNVAATKEYYGQANVTDTAGALAITVNSSVLTNREYVLEVKDGTRKGRVVIPDGQVTERGDVTYVHSDAIKYEVTITAYPDASGNKAYIYWDTAA